MSGRSRNGGRVAGWNLEGAGALVKPARRCWRDSFAVSHSRRRCVVAREPGK
jgi:hypothetical protein